METVNVTEAKAKFSAIVERVCAGEEVVVTRHGKPAVKIIPAEPKKKFRLLGLYEGQGWMAPDFDEWPEEEARALGIID